MALPAPRLLTGAAALLTLLGLGCAPRANSAAASGWYSAEPLLVSLRPEARARLGARALEELPLYDLDASVDLAQAKLALREEAWITVPEGETWDEAVLRLYANVPATRSGKTPPLRLVSGTCEAPGSGCSVAAESPSAIVVKPGATLAAGSRLRLHLVLEGSLERIDGSRTSLLAQGLESLKALAGGEGAGNYGLFGVGDGIASFGNFYPVLARRAAAGWERAEPSALGDLGSDDVSNVRGRIEVPLGASVASSGVVVSDEPAASGRHAVRVAAAAVRDFAFVAGADLDGRTRDVGGVAVRSTFRRSDRAAGERALDVAAASLADYERRFGPYPYPTLGVAEAAIVGGAGGVEWSGFVTIASMFYKSSSTPMPAGVTDSMLEFVVAHEVAHQYWHGLVGSDSRAHPFMDEALAQYSAIVYLEDRYGKERAERDGLLDVQANYQMMRMLGAADAPADQPVEAFASPMTYAGIVYGKAPYYFAAMRRALGDDEFFAALRGYAERYAFRVATPEALTAAFSSRSAGVEPLAQRWLHEMHGDDDLGKADLAKMIGSMVDPETARQLGPLLKSLGDGGAIDVSELMKRLAP